MISKRVCGPAGAAMAILLVGVWAPIAGADPLADDQAREAYERGVERFMAGNYSLAADALAKAVGNATMHDAAALALARVHIMQGAYSQAIETLADAEPSDADPGGRQGVADWRLAMVEALEATGQYAEALRHAEQAGELAPLWAPTLLARGRLLETLGQNEQAAAIYETMDRIVADGSYRSDARTLVALGEILARHAMLTGLKASEQANNIFNNYLQVAYQDVDERHWQAHVVAGRFAISKHRFETAEGEFNSALQYNRHLPDAFVGLAIVQLEQWEFEECLKYVRLALGVNPNHAGAQLVEAVCLLQWRKIDQVPAVLERILQTNPNDLEALSLAAATQIRLGDDQAAQQYMDRVRQINPRCELLPLAIADWLSAARQFDRAEQYYRQAIELAPHLAGPPTGLGELYMQTGEETLARQMFKRANDIDDFRADVVNYLNLLAEMEDYLVLESEHFIVKVSGEHDEVLLDQVAAEAERIFEEVCADFQHVPPAKTIIEVFPTHPKFSVRMTGRGWLGTVGACTGRVIVLVAPSEERSLFGTYNWVAVLRHEFAHTVTLSATNSRIPHWFTEACAVWQQPDRRNFEAVQTLVTATRENRLFPVSQLDWGFIRPRRGGDRGLAYAQAEWMMEYIIETQGFDKIIDMLTAFRDGMKQPDVFAEVLGTTEDDFDEAFVNWARQRVERWGFDARPMPEISELAGQVRQRPDDMDLLADYALVLMRNNDAPGAQAAAAKVLEIDEQNVKALGVMAVALLVQERHEEAVGYALTLELADEQSPIAARVLADSYLALKQWSLAILWLEELKLRRPMDPRSYEQLTVIYIQLGLTDMALPNLVELHRWTMTDQEYARQIATIYRDAGEEDRALHYFQQIAHINPYEASAYEAMAAIHRNARRYGQAVAEARRLTLLQPDSADAWAKLAMMRFVAARASGDRDALAQAVDEATRSLELDPDGGADIVLEGIRREMGLTPDNPVPQDQEPASP